MEKIPQTPTKSPAGDRTSDQNTPPPRNQTGSPKSQSPICSTGRRTGTPDLLKVPKAFKYPERYKSPTDQMISPVTRGILARTKTGRKLLPPTNQPKIEALKLMETSRFQLEKC